MMTLCPDCGAALQQVGAADYVMCPTCETFVLQSHVDAEAENTAYFNEHFRETITAQIDARKQQIFRRAEALDRAARQNEQNRFQSHLQHIREQLLRPGQRVLEIGFGGGALLAQLLQTGIEAWGEDLSQTAIENFQRQYPAWAGQVAPPSSIPGTFDIIYTSALFEHLDDPRAFLQAAQARLRPGGQLILDQFPIAVAGPADLTAADDICFWKPCHRVLHSPEGVRRVAAAAGYDVAALETMDSYNYRVLSLHRRAGYPVVESIRHSFWVDTRLPGLWRYRWLCWRARHIRSRCHAASVILRSQTNDAIKGAPTP